MEIRKGVRAEGDPRERSGAALGEERAETAPRAGLHHRRRIAAGTVRRTGKDHHVAVRAAITRHRRRALSPPLLTEEEGDIGERGERCTGVLDSTAAIGSSPLVHLKLRHGERRVREWERAEGLKPPRLATPVKPPSSSKLATASRAVAISAQRHRG
ncbi:uncharacterized protein [Arachis hypogaea]|uniref:uncharacterized protein n=1 Tax=Arachis hypogaea TaxID=3818 RepID=UPI003B2186B8|nr:uncharacterized protein DS421_3g85160 [Arachis hypogaea]